MVVSNATLHNEDYIAGRDARGGTIRDGKDIRVGVTVLQRCNGSEVSFSIKSRIGTVNIQSTSSGLPGNNVANSIPSEIGSMTNLGEKFALSLVLFNKIYHTNDVWI